MCDGCGRADRSIPTPSCSCDQVTVRRGEKLLLDSVDWTVEEDERWAVLGPNGAGKTTLLQIAAATHAPDLGRAPTSSASGSARVDVFELRPRIGFASAALAQRIPADELVIDVVVSAGYSVLGRWREAYGRLDVRRATALLERFGVGELADRTLRHAVRGRAQAGADRPGADDRPGAAAARRAGGRHGPRRPRGPACAGCRGSPLDPEAPASVLVTHHVEEIPPGITHVAAAARRPGRRRPGWPATCCTARPPERRPSACQLRVERTRADAGTPAPPT